MLPSNDKASPGQPFHPPPAEVWNGMVDAGNAYRAGRLSVGTPDRTRPRSTDLIKIKNNSGADRARGEILRINGKAITDLSDEHIWLGGSAPTADGYFGILKEPIAEGEVGRAQVSGCCLAMVDIGSTSHERARPASGEYVLESADDGPIEILYAPDETGEAECVVRFGSAGGGAETEFFNFVATGDEAANEMAANLSAINDFAGSSVLLATTLKVHPIFSGLTTGTTGICVKIGSDYYVLQAACPPEAVVEPEEE